MVESGSGAAAPATEPPKVTFTEAEVQARVSAATSTVQKALTAAEQRAGLFEKRAVVAEETKVTSDRALTSSQREVAVLKKAESLGEDPIAWSQWMAGEEARLETARSDVGRAQLHAEATRLANQTGMPEATLLTARTGAEMYQMALDFSIANPPQPPAPDAPAAANPPAADVAAPAPDKPAVPADAPTSQPDRGGAGNAGASPSEKHGTALIAEGLRENPAFKAFFDQYPDA